MTEHDQAILIANKWLDHPPDLFGDPDCDPCIIARQFLRALERLEQYERSAKTTTAVDRVVLFHNDERLEGLK